MSFPRIFISQLFQAGDTLPLDNNNFGHLIRVLRFKERDEIRVFNGQGSEYQAQITHIEKKSAFIYISRQLRKDPEAKLHIHLGQVISKGDKMDFTLQKATELGVNAITPLWSERCDVRLKGERLEKKMEHWQKIIISACEQCGRNRIPVLHLPLLLDDWVNSLESDLKLILHPHKQQALTNYTKPCSLSVLVGPEGGFTDREVSFTRQQGFNGLTLGPRILRTETAALAALSVFQFYWGDFTA